MNESLRLESQALMREIARYLAVVDAFRTELCEPTWLPEPPQGAAARARRSPRCGAPASRTHRA